MRAPTILATGLVLIGILAAPAAAGGPDGRPVRLAIPDFTLDTELQEREPALGKEAEPAESALKSSLEDPSPIVRIAAAEALCNLGHVDDMLPVLTDGLKHATPYVRLRAINALDRLGQKARPALPAIRAAAISWDSASGVRSGSMDGSCESSFRIR